MSEEIEQYTPLTIVSAICDKILAEGYAWVETLQSQPGDLHVNVVAQALGIPAEDVTPVMRSSSKQVLFGYLYRMSTAQLVAALQRPRASSAEGGDRNEQGS